MQEICDEKVTARYIFQRKCYFSIFFCPSFIGMWKNSKCTFNVYLCNLRRHHNRFHTLRRCHGGIINFPTLNIWEIDLLGTSYIHVDFLTCRICRTAELEVLIPTFCNTVTNYILNWLNLKILWNLWNSFVTTTSQFSLNVLKLRVPVNVTILCRISDCVCACVCVCLPPSTLKASSVWGWKSRVQVNDVVLKTLFSSAKFLHRYFSMNHQAFLN